MRVGVLSTWAFDDLDAWSGVLAPMTAALRESVDVVTLPRLTATHHPLDRGLTRLLDRPGRRYLPDHGLATSRSAGRVVADAVEASGVEVVLSVAASTFLAHAQVRVPVIEVGDATWRLLVGYYPLYTRLHPLTRWQGEVLGRRTARRAAGFLLASHWAAASLVSDYGVDPLRVCVAPFGPSTVAADSSRGPWPGEPLRILFVCSDWIRKGGDVAVEVVAALRAAGTACELTVVGDAPGLPDGVRALGRVPRSRMVELYAAHDVLLEPARANAGGVTITDATASGLPVVATRTGGVPTIVDDGVTGMLVDPAHPVPGAVAALRSLTDHVRWREMSRAARRRGAEDLSWHAWAASAAQMCARVLDVEGRLS